MVIESLVPRFLIKNLYFPGKSLWSLLPGEGLNYRELMY